jgi:hypothetical protein
LSDCNIEISQNKSFRFKIEPKAKNIQFFGMNWVFDQFFVREEVKAEFKKKWNWLF